MNLPNEFKIKMEMLLKNEYIDFINSYQNQNIKGIRVNTLKISIDEFIKLNTFNLNPIPWVHDGFYYGTHDNPGKHPFHHAGLYYMQEPSAMAVAEFVAPQPGERILDLCAAPGGKSTHLASKMQGEGFILTNEINPLRAKILAQNIERMGITNAVVTNETPERLSGKFPDYFNRILVDAPCSGEGMFRKDPEAMEHWSLDNVEMCAKRQLSILNDAHKMLKSNGRLVYSTCTFSPEENEGVISNFLKHHPGYEIEHLQTYEKFDKGRIDWVEDCVPEIKHTLRLWPHRIQGEGHFIAVLRKGNVKNRSKFEKVHFINDKSCLKDYYRFIDNDLNISIDGELVLFGENLYKVPKEMVSLKNIRIIRPGLHLGELKKNRFKPSHSLAMALNSSQVKKTISLPVDSHQVSAYLKGEPLPLSMPKGWYQVHVEGYPLGWGKLSDDVLKNHYPKGLRTY